ncbi:murein L,D-transpeptidase [Shimia sp. NS0008-38b]
MKRAIGRVLFLVLICLVASVSTYRLRHHLPAPVIEHLGLGADISEIREFQSAKLTRALTDKDLRFGAPVFIRIFKEERELEIWVESTDGTYVLFKNYPICSFSGSLGPKLREGDRQSPEGFYRVSKAALNPNSAYHLSFNLGFPNAYDRAQNRTGSHLMVHGNCLSVGCYAMTDPAIEEIYVLVEAALSNGQSFVPVHAFPFHPTAIRLRQESHSEWHDFWSKLAPAYHAFETTRRPPDVFVANNKYRISAP